MRDAGRAGHRHGCSAHLLLVVSGNTVPFFNMTIVHVPEDLELGKWGSLGEVLGCKRSG